MLVKTGVDDLAVVLGDSFRDRFLELMKEAKDPLVKLIKTKKEIDQKLKYQALPNFSMVILPDLCKKFIEWSSVSTHCSDQALVLPFISVCAASLRKSVAIEGPTYDLIYPNIWQVILGKSGSGKTTGIKISTSLLNKLEEAQIKLWKPIYKEYQFQLEEYERQRKNSKNQEDSNNLREPEYPPSKAIGMPLIASLERYNEILALDTPCGFIFTAEELGAWFQNLKKVENLKEFLTSCYGGEVPHNLISYKNARDLKLDNPIVSILGPSTPDWIFKDLRFSDYRSGFFQRTLWCFNISNKLPKARPAKRDTQMVAMFESKLRKLYEFGLKLNKPIVFKLSEEAKVHFEEVIFPELQKKIADTMDDIVISCLNRYWNEYLYKFALVFHCMEDNFESRKEISLDTLIQAHSLMQYYEESLSLVLNEIENSRLTNMTFKIVDRLRKATELTISERDLASKMKGYSDNREVFCEALDRLRDMGIIEISKSQSKSNNGSETSLIHLLQRVN